MKWWSIGIATANILLVLIGSFCTVGSRSHYVCIDCGLEWSDLRMVGIPVPSYHKQVRTKWYDRRIGTPHQHRWTKTTCTAGLNLWQKTTSYSCGRAEPIIDERWAVMVLERLEPLTLDVKYHRELTHPDRSHREAAASGWLSFDPGWKDELVVRWWQKMERFMADPTAWDAGFEVYEK